MQSSHQHYLDNWEPRCESANTQCPHRVVSARLSTATHSPPLKPAVPILTVLDQENKCTGCIHHAACNIARKQPSSKWWLQIWRWAYPVPVGGRRREICYMHWKGAPVSNFRPALIPSMHCLGYCVEPLGQLETCQPCARHLSVFLLHPCGAESNTQHYLNRKRWGSFVWNELCCVAYHWLSN